MKTINIDHTRATSYYAQLTFTSGGIATNLSGSTITMSIKRDLDDLEYIVQATATITTPSSGIAEINILADDLNIENGEYYYTIIWKDNSDLVYPIIKGNFNISFNAKN